MAAAGSKSGPLIPASLLVKYSGTIVSNCCMNRLTTYGTLLLSSSRLRAPAKETLINSLRTSVAASTVSGSGSFGPSGSGSTGGGGGSTFFGGINRPFRNECACPRSQVVATRHSGRSRTLLSVSVSIPPDSTATRIQKLRGSRDTKDGKHGHRGSYPAPTGVFERCFCTHTATPRSFLTTQHASHVSRC